MKSKALQCVSKIEKSKLSQNGLWLKGTPGDHLVHICCSKQSQLEQAAQEHVQLDFEYGQGWRLHHFSGQPVVVFSHSCSKGWGGGGGGNVLMFKWNLLYFKKFLFLSLDQMQGLVY